MTGSVEVHPPFFLSYARSADSGQNFSPRGPDRLVVGQRGHGDRTVPVQDVGAGGSGSHSKKLLLSSPGSNVHGSTRYVRGSTR
jgi:hypothetical protein